MSARASRAGFFGYAALLVTDFVLVRVHRRLLDAALAAPGGFSDSTALRWMPRAYVAASVLLALTLVLIGAAPRGARARGLAYASASLVAIEVFVEVLQEIGLRAEVVGSGLLPLLQAVALLLGLADGAATVLLLVVVLRIGAAARAKAVRPIGVAALVVVGARTLLRSITVLKGDDPGRLVHLAHDVLFYGGQALVIALCLYAGVLSTRVPAPARPPADGAPEDLSRAWRVPAGGISLYLIAAVARMACSLLSYAVMSGAQGDGGYTHLHEVRDGVIAVAFLSGAATLTMLAGVWGIARAPSESGASAPAMLALVLMIGGFALDLVSTSMTAEALGGSLSAAFAAMDALPVIGCLSTIAGVGSTVSLLTAFRKMASTLGVPVLGERARSTSILVMITGSIAALTLVALTKLPVELLLVLAVLLVPLAVAVLVQFLRVALPIRQTIRARLGYDRG